MTPCHITGQMGPTGRDLQCYAMVDDFSHKIALIIIIYKRRIQSIMPLTKEDFEALADAVILHRRGRALQRRFRNRRFRAGLGVSSYVCSWYWNQLEKEKLLPKGFLPKHFLWTLLFLKIYASEHVHAAMCGCDETTFRKWVWIGLKVIGDLELVSAEVQKVSYAVINNQF